MVIVADDINYYYSGGASNAAGASSIGAAIGTEIPANGVIFDDVTGIQSRDSHEDYRCVYVKNDHASLDLIDAVVYIQTQPAESEIDIALDAAAIGPGETGASVAQTIVDETTAPTSVTFSRPATEATAIPIGTIPFGSAKAIWIRRDTDAGASAINNDTLIIRVQGDSAE